MDEVGKPSGEFRRHQFEPLQEPAVMFETTRRVEFRDTDSAQFAHFSAFFTYMEEAEHALFREIGTSVHVPDGDHVLSWPRVSASCDYQRPVRFEDVMTIQLGIDHIGDSSVKFRCRFNRDGRRIAEGSITIVCCELRAGKSPQKRAIPDTIRSQLQKFLWQDSEES